MKCSKNKQQLKKQILLKELQIKKMHLLKDDTCNSLCNSLILEKAILKKELEDINKNQFLEGIKSLFSKKEKLICDYWK